VHLRTIAREWPRLPGSVHFVDLRCDLGGHPRVQALPKWLGDRPYLLSIEEIKIHCGWPSLSKSVWDIAIASSSTLNHLTLVGPVLIRRREGLPSIIESRRFNTLIALALTTLRLALTRGIDSLMD
jgi:hypothetical protein